jgi:hypothetical protein
MRFSLVSQWGLAALAWIVLGVVASIVDVRDDHGVELILFAAWAVPGTLMLTASAVRNSWVRCMDPARFRHDQERARRSV